MWVLPSSWSLRTGAPRGDCSGVARASHGDEGITIRRLILVVGLGGALIGSVYLAKIATQDRMMDTLRWTSLGYGRPRN
jgi:hypothetical protein